MSLTSQILLNYRNGHRGETVAGVSPVPSRAARSRFFTGATVNPPSPYLGSTGQAYHFPRHASASGGTQVRAGGPRGISATISVLRLTPPLAMRTSKETGRTPIRPAGANPAPPQTVRGSGICGPGGALGTLPGPSLYQHTSSGGIAAR